MRQTAVAESVRGVAVAEGEHNTRRRLKGRIALRVAGEPVEVEALIAPAERVERVAHPDSPAGECDLLRKNSLSQDRRSMSTLQCFGEQRLARARRQWPVHQSERHNCCGH